VQGLIEHSLNCRLEFISNELIDKILSHHIVRGVTYKFTRTLVPYINFSFCVDPEDRGVGCVNQFCILPLLGNSTCDILPNTNNSNNLAMLITSCSSIQKHLNASPSLSDQGEFIVSSFNTGKSLIKNSLHRSLVVLSNEFLDKRMPHDFSCAVTYKLAGTNVPYIDTSKRINTEDRRIC